MSAYHNSELGNAIQVSSIVLEDLSADKITRDKRREGEGEGQHLVFTLSVNETEFAYSGEKAKHNRNSDYYRLLNAVNKATEKTAEATE